MKTLKLLILVGVVLSITACNENFLDSKPNKNLVVPESLTDLQGILDQGSTFNTAVLSVQQLVSDDIFVTDQILNLNNDFTQTMYIWQDYDDSFTITDWVNGYQVIFEANIVLHISNEIIPTNNAEQHWLNQIQGSAYFKRGMKYWELLQQFSVAYDETTAESDLGIIIPKTINVEDKFPRSSVKESYEQVLKDLELAEQLLDYESEFKFRPNKVAVYALLARVHLSMGNYQESYRYADLALNRHPYLLDYNTLVKSTVATDALPAFNEEVIYHSRIGTYSMSLTNNTTGGFVAPELMATYHENDLRRNLFFRNFGDYYRILGKYTSNFDGFGGLATDELYLTRAETKVRLGDIQGGMDDLNTMLLARWKYDTFEPYFVESETEALEIILLERRKQLIHRGLRWTDLKRLNKDPRFAKTLTRTSQGVAYSLPPNDPRYAFLIPHSEISLNNLVKQNPR